MTATQKFYSVFFLVLAVIVLASFAAGYRTGLGARTHVDVRAHRSAPSTGP